MATAQPGSNVYSFLNFQCAINGPGGSINLGNGAGNAEEGVSFTPTGDRSAMQMGADGSGQHSLYAEKSGKIVVRLLKTSPTNALLMALFNAQTANAANHGQNVISGTDTQRGDSITCSQVAFSKLPDLTYGKEAGLIEWEFMAIQMNITLGA